MADIGNLVVKIGLDSSSFSRGLSVVNSKINSLVGSVQKNIGNAFKYAAVTAAATLTGIGYEITRTQNRLNEIARASQSINITPQQGLGLEYLAKRIDVSSEEVYKSIELMQYNIQQALSSGVQQDVLKKLGLDPAQLEALKDPIQQIEQIGDAIAKVKSKSEQIFDARTLFGRSGNDLLGAFHEGFKNVLDDMEKFRTNLTDADFAAIQKGDDAFDNLGTSIQGIIDKITVNLTPSITAFVDAFTNAVKQFGGFDKVANAVSASLLSALSSIFNFFSKIDEGIKNIKLSTLFVAQGFLNLKKSILESSQGMSEFGQKLLFGDTVANSLKKVEIQLNTIRDIQDEVGKSAPAKSSVGSFISSLTSNFSKNLSSESNRITALPNTPPAALTNNKQNIVGTITVGIDASPELIARLKKTEVGQSSGVNIVTSTTTDIARQVAR
jgi:hypothetical protein